MTYQEHRYHKEQQQDSKDYFRPPISPIPPLSTDNHVSYRPCRYCGKQLIIRLERIPNSNKGKIRFRRIPRPADNLNEIHNCRKSANNTSKHEGVN